MVTNQSPYDVELSLAIIPLDKFGNDAAGTGMPMFACTFWAGETKNPPVRWVCLEKNAASLLKVVAREISPIMKLLKIRTLDPRNGICRDKQGALDIQGKSVDESLVHALKVQVSRMINPLPAPDLWDGIQPQLAV